MMPNWCNNTITIQGPTETLKPLWDEAQRTGLLNAIKPMPEALEDTTSPTPDDKVQPKVDGFDNWYDWRVANWGCKWDVDTEGLEYEDNGDGTASIAGWFDSPWGPPIEAYNTFCDDMANCSLEAFYEEGGMDFAGHYTSEGVDDYIEGISDFAREVVKGNDSGSDLYDLLDEHFEITENRREWIEEQLNEDAQKVHDFVVEGRAVNGTMKETAQ
jgi:hypothetical protein